MKNTNEVVTDFIKNIINKFLIFMKFKIKNITKGKLLFVTRIEKFHPMYQFLVNNLNCDENIKLELVHGDTGITLKSNTCSNKFNYKKNIIKFKYNSTKDYSIDIYFYSRNKIDNFGNILLDFLKEQFNFDISRDLYYYYFFPYDKNICDFLDLLQTTNTIYNLVTGTYTGNYKCNWIGKELFKMDNNSNINNYKIFSSNNLNHIKYVKFGEDIQYPQIITNLDSSRYSIHNYILHVDLLESCYMMCSKSKQLSTYELSKEMGKFLNFNTCYNDFPILGDRVYFLIFRHEQFSFHSLTHLYNLDSPTNNKFDHLKFFANSEIKNNIRDHLYHICMKKKLSVSIGCIERNSHLFYGPDDNSKLYLSVILLRNLVNYYPIIVNSNGLLSFYQMTNDDFRKKRHIGNISHLGFVFYDMKLEDMECLFKCIKSKGILNYVVITNDERIKGEILNKFDYAFYFDYCDKYLIKYILDECISIQLKYINEYYDPNLPIFPNHLKFCKDYCRKYNQMTLDDFNEKISGFVDNVCEYKILSTTLLKYLMKYIDDIDGIFKNYDQLIK